MTWVRIDDSFADHPKFADLSNDATATWLRLLAYCNRYMTDGEVRRSVALRATRTDNPDAVMGELVAAGLVHDHGDAFELHDYLNFQASRAQLEQARTAGAARKAASRERRKAGASPMPRESLADASPMPRCDSAVTPHDVTPMPRECLARSHAPVTATHPTPPHPTQEENFEERASALPASEPREVGEVVKLEPKPRKVRPPSSPMPAEDDVSAWLESLGLPSLTDAQWGREVAKWLDYHRARANRFVDWRAAWRTWRTNAEEFRRSGPVGRGVPMRQQGAAYVVPVEGGGTWE